MLTSNVNADCDRAALQPIVGCATNRAECPHHVCLCPMKPQQGAIEPLRVALIGLGAIGARVLELLRSEPAHSCAVVAVLLRRQSATRTNSRYAASSALFVDDLPGLLARSPDLVVECAGHEAVDTCAAPILAAGIPLVLSSIGALAAPDREHRLRTAAANGRTQLILPAGAVAAIDWLAAAKLAGLHSVVYRSRKPPLAWLGTAAEQACPLGELTTAVCFYAGNAREAALAYPKNANVAATVALAGLGFDDTRVELIADPGAAGNGHEIEASGVTGRLQMSVLGLPDPDNPRTSMTTAFSVARAVLQRAGSIVI